MIVSCSKDQESNIPSVPVNERVNLDNPDNANLNVIGGSITIPGGLRGIIVYRRSDQEYTALDRMCSYQSNNTNAIVNLDNSVSIGTDSTCGSRFQLTDGSPVGGPASQPLRSYKTTLVGRDLYISN